MRPRSTLRIAAFLSLLGASLAATGSLATQAEACRAIRSDPRYTMDILVDGRVLPPLDHRGTTYVEALKGREYAIRLTNRTGERVAVALAVDGLNSIDAKHTSSRGARKWILGPWDSITLSGWQTSSGTARRFVFTSEAGSYGAWLGRTSDLGVISAAFFREVRRSPLPAPDAEVSEGLFRRDQAGDAAAAAPQAKALGESRASANDELAATGIGREVEHRVTQVDFDEEAVAASIVNVRYEYRDALVRLGVLPRSDDDLARREGARGFDDRGFAPDPYRRPR